MCITPFLHYIECCEYSHAFNCFCLSWMFSVCFLVHRTSPGTSFRRCRTWVLDSVGYLARLAYNPPVWWLKLCKQTTIHYSFVFQKVNRWKMFSATAAAMSTFSWKCYSLRSDWVNEVRELKKEELTDRESTWRSRSVGIRWISRTLW